MNPEDLVVFISHATQDNERFVVRFNHELRRLGLATILDVQNFGLGQSLIANIFDRGIYAANAIVIVVSQYTPGRPYVRAELEHAVLRNIEEEIPVITVVLDGADVPPPLRTALQLRIGADIDPDKAANDVANTFQGGRAYIKPAGAKPKARWTLAAVDGLLETSTLDDYVSRYAIEQLLASNFEFVDVSALLKEIEQHGKHTADDLDASLYALEMNGWIEREHEMGSRLPFAFKVTVYGVRALLERYAPDLLKDATSSIVSQIKQSYPGAVDIADIGATAATPEIVILNIAQSLEARGLARVSTYAGGWGDVAGTPLILRA